MLKDKILNREPGIITYGITPPKQTYTHDKITEISQKQIDRIKDLEIDGLILYDVQEESDRTEQERPFPYLETIDPTVYSRIYLGQLEIPKVIYRCVGKYTQEQLTEWIQSDVEEDRFSVFVGASSSKQEVKLGLSEAYELIQRLNDKIILGGVVIPERHLKKQDEHLRIVNKVNQGCDFFISQATYNVEAAKNFLSDYYYHCQSIAIDMVPILVNLAPCGSQKTLDFMKWLGISIPHWLENELLFSNDILDKSVSLCAQIFTELYEYGMEKGIPIGCSIESVSTRKVEIEASIQLVRDITKIIGKHCSD